ncbi:MAG: CorA family divalent cation transporter, partial [Pseudomonadales bacterium]|nr:CorA family divalent cation transporter [Pseudomonadales bacterium]
IMDEENAYRLHEQSDRIMRYVEDIDLVRERALVLQEELMNRIAQEQNARMYMLSIVAVIFMPVTFVTGVFGMNVAGLPGLEQPGAFMQVVAVMSLIVAGVLWLLRRKRWL